MQVLLGLAHRVLWCSWYAATNTIALCHILASIIYTHACCGSSESCFWFGPVIFLHDPVSFAALVRPELFTFKKGVVRVETEGICVGHTSMDMLLKK